MIRLLSYCVLMHLVRPLLITSRVYDYVTCRDYMFHAVKWLEGHINTKGPTIVAGDFTCPDINWLNWSVPSNPVSAQATYQLRAGRYCATVDPMLSVGADTAGRVRRAVVGRAAGPLRCATRLGARPATVCALHGGVTSACRASRRQSAPVR